MGFINVFVASNVYANIENNQLKLTKKDSKDSITYPLSDLNSVLFDDSYSTITLKTLVSLAENNIITYFCDDKHLPQLYLLSYNSYYKNFAVYKNQVNVKKPVIKNIWKNIIKQKILNQIKTLNLLNINNDLEIYLNNIKSDDNLNTEAVVANKYFKLLFGNEFNRRNDLIDINSALNYGYSIIRGAISRSIVAHGLQPILGIHHINELNNFNLADDLIEPFRPIVDLYVASNLDIFNKNLDTSLKILLLNLLNLNVLWDNQVQTVNYAIDCFVENYIKCISNNDFNIKTPKIMEIEIHSYE